MKVKYIIDETFQDYKHPAMLIGTCYCDFKCGKDICQNVDLSKQPNIEISNNKIVNRYVKNKITKAVVFGGLEPFVQINQVKELIKCFREKTNDIIVIYTGYYLREISKQVNSLKIYNNIIIKFGRYIPNQKKIYNELLGIWLISDNQYTIKIS